MRVSSFFCNLIILLPTIVSGKCTCELEEDDRNKNLALKYKLVAIATILVASAAGVCIPVVGRIVAALSPEKNFFVIVKAFAAGVIMSTGCVHILPDAFESLTSPCVGDSPWGDFPLTGFITMVGAIGTLMVDTYATAYSKRQKIVKDDDEEEDRVAFVHSESTHEHSHGSLSLEVEAEETQLRRHRVITQVLEVGIIVHSVIIGIALGTSRSPKTIKPLIAALSFHQFFEGVGLGGCITQAKYNVRVVVMMAVFFSLTTPIGIVIGIGISNVYTETSATALIVQGVFNSISAGILIYMAMVDLIAAEFMSSKMQTNPKLLLEAYVSLLLGAGCMSLLAKWT